MTVEVSSRTFLSAANIDIHCMGASSSDIAVWTVQEAAFSSSTGEVGNVDGPISRGESGPSQEEGTCIIIQQKTMKYCRQLE